VNVDIGENNDPEKGPCPVSNADVINKSKASMTYV
jgi:hypothetical protein